MGRLIRNYPFAVILGWTGFFIGISFLFSVDFLFNYEGGKLNENIVDVLIDYLRESTATVVKVFAKGILLGIATGVSLGLAGFFVDLMRNRSTSRTYYRGSVQKIIEGNLK